MLITNAYRRLNMWNANCDASFEWVGRAINPYLGFMTCWLMIAGYIIGTVSAVEVLGPSVLYTAAQVGRRRLPRLDPGEIPAGRPRGADLVDGGDHRRRTDPDALRALRAAITVLRNPAGERRPAAMIRNQQ
jgi:hypothetical protein